MDVQKQGQDVAFLQAAPAKEIDSILNKHLNATELLEYIEKLLMGYEYNSEEEEWKPIMIEITDSEGNVHLTKQGPILDPNHVRLTIGYLKTFMNSNTYLSYIEKMEQINEMMWDIKKKVVTLLHPLKKRFDGKMIDVIGSMVENSIYMALLRSYRKTTLDAVSKMQHSIEHLNNQNANPQSQTSAKKPFKIFGF